MKKSFFPLVIASIAFLGFRALPHDSFSASPKIFAGEPFTTQYFVPLDGEVMTNICTGEELTLSGNIHYVVRGHYNASTNTLTQSIYSNLQGVKATGQSSGNIYHIVDTHHVTDSWDYSGGMLRSTDVENLHFTTAGGEDNVSIKVRFTFIIDFATHEVEVIKDDTSIECQ